VKGALGVHDVAKARKQRSMTTLSKAATGIAGLDELTHGGLPRGRPTLVIGRAGCGKIVLGLEFLVRGAVEFGEPGVIVSFEETPQELATNVASFGFDLNDLSNIERVLVGLDLRPLSSKKAGP
jgi:circadian clock protein KaiC